ncbi:MAG: hypothetical protein KC502_09000 [Myxococcales bacterium]|nr:hypothetical protein [Myxococcales bacterium]
MFRLPSRLNLTMSLVLPLSVLLGLVGCTPPAQSDSPANDAQGAKGDGDIVVSFDIKSNPDGAQTDAAADGAASDVGGGQDDVFVDVQVADSSIAPDSSVAADSVAPDGESPDASAPAPDSQSTDGQTTDGQITQPKPCGQTTFAYKPTPGVKQVLLSGSFNGWATTAAKASILLDDDGDGVWTTTLVLQPGQWQYKFIVDGTWLPDPTNPNKVDDGFGNKNSVLTVAPCPKALKLDSQQNTGAGIEATFSTPLGPIDPKKVTVTLDHQAVSAAAVSWSGGKLHIKITGLATGIHDVRVAVDTADGEQMWLLKVYNGVSTDWRDATLYFVMTDRFNNGDKTNDNILPNVDPRTNFSGGDFAGISAKIDSGYFTKLGASALWLSWPVKQPAYAEQGTFPDGTGCGLGPGKVKYSPMKYSGYHGYWPADSDKTEPRFGSLAELQQLVDKAHAKGIRILLDYTANHVHTSNPWFAKYKDKGWFHTPAEVCQDVGWDNKPVTCWFTSYLADMNYGNPQVIEASLKSAMWWAKQSGADGFRLDAVKHIEMDFIKALRKRAKEEMELTGIDFYIVGETFTGDAQAIQAFVGADKIHAQFDFPANMQLLQGFAKASKGLGQMDDVIRGIRSVYTDQGALMSTFIGNHDMARFISHASGDLPCGPWDMISNQAAGWKNPPKVPSTQLPYDRLKLGFTYLFTTPGVPLIYYGDEFGLPGAGDPDNRRMMRFGSDLSAKEQATLTYLSELGKLRAAHPALRKGKWSKALWKEADFLSWARTATGDQVVVLINRGSGAKKGGLTVTPAGIADGTELVEWFTKKKVKIAGGKLAFDVPASSAQVWTTQ